jgi:hypothetical protein
MIAIEIALIKMVGNIEQPASKSCEAVFSLLPRFRYAVPLEVVADAARVIRY